MEIKPYTYVYNVYQEESIFLDCTCNFKLKILFISSGPQAKCLNIWYYFSFWTFILLIVVGVVFLDYTIVWFCSHEKKSCDSDNKF